MISKQDIHIGIIGIGAIISAYGIMEADLLKPLFEYNAYLTIGIGILIMVFAGRMIKPL